MFKIYTVTNRTQTGKRHLISVLEEVIAGGVDAIILREKDLLPGELYKLACGIKELCSGTETKLLVHSSVEVALACEADGVHLGFGSLPPEAARGMLPDKIIGVSVHSPEEAWQAETGGADYVLAGMFLQPAASLDSQAGVSISLKR